MKTKQQSLRGYLPAALAALIEQYGEKPYRAKQLSSFLFNPNISSWDGYTSISKNLREKLAGDFSFCSLSPEAQLTSKEDGTVKFLFKTHDGLQVESVYIPQSTRKTVCLSTQVGCKYKCAFCMSGKKGLIRNLDASEIVDQIFLIAAAMNTVPTNIVYMGMGEPMDNYQNMIRSVRICMDKEGWQIGARHITISTVGIPSGIECFAREGLSQIKLALSLHAPHNNLRSALMPVNEKHPIEEIMAVLKNYREKFKRTITFEYVLLNEINDSPDDALALWRLARSARAKINLIIYNAVQDSRTFRPSIQKRVEAFAEILKKQNALYTIRKSGGQDIFAACGQLRHERGL